MVVLKTENCFLAPRQAAHSLHCQMCYQANLEKPTPIAAERARFWQDYYNYEINYIIKKYGNESFVQKLKRKLKSILS